MPAYTEVQQGKRADSHRGLCSIVTAEQIQGNNAGGGENSPKFHSADN
jgi:hypothetical protein